MTQEYAHTLTSIDLPKVFKRSKISKKAINNVYFSSPKNRKSCYLDHLIFPSLNWKASRKPVSQPWRFAHDHHTSPDMSIVTNFNHTYYHD